MQYSIYEAVLRSIMSLDVVVFGTSGRFTDESYLKKFGLLWKVQFPKKYTLKDSTGSPMSKEKALQFRNEQLRIFESRLDETSQYYDPMYILWDKRVRRWTFDDGTVYRSFARLDDAIAARKKHIPSFMQNPLHLIKKGGSKSAKRGKWAAWSHGTSSWR